MLSSCVVVWFRNDLRLLDHAPLRAALKVRSQIIPIYCFDPRHFGQTSYGFPKTGVFRAQFLLESLASLRTALQSIGSNLVIRTGLPEEILPQFARSVGATAFYYHAEVTPEETQVEQNLEAALTDLGIPSRRFWGSTLHNPEDLPFAIADLPDVFTTFRKAVEQQSTVQTPFPAPKILAPIPDVLNPGALPTLAGFGLSPVPDDPRQRFSFQGGEASGQARVQDYLWNQDYLLTYKQTRNSLLHANDSSKLSPWLALGCLSPRWVYAQIKAYEAERVANDSTDWLVFELLWRDYFRWVAAKYRGRLFRASGVQGVSLPWRTDLEHFQAWQQGQTGFPLIDANMQELQASGFMSNRGRQNVARFLTQNLGIHWHLGAEWFESQLIDYDVCSNWGSWNHIAGIGPDPRPFRRFNILKQAQSYDPQGEYVKHWLPVLAPLPPEQVHQPWQLTEAEQAQWDLRLGIDYPRAIAGHTLSEIWADHVRSE